MRVAFAALICLIASSCQPSIRDDRIHLSEIGSMNLADAVTYGQLCSVLLNHPEPVGLSDLLANPNTYDKKTVLVTGKYFVSETRSELVLDKGGSVWLDMPLRPELHRKLITVSGTFTTMRTSPERPAATICAISAAGLSSNEP